MIAMVAGAGGQLGRALISSAPDGVEVIGLDKDALDITDPDAVDRKVAAVRPTFLFNAAAYSAVDRAEGDEAQALAVNAVAVGSLARAAQAAGALLVHVSTDFVFDGAQGTPYAPDSEPAPLNAYGRTKLAGERAAGGDALIVRTAWLYGLQGTNFVRTMLRLMSERPEIGVVADQIGTPTYAPGLATAMWALAGQRARGIYHYTDSGVASWYDFAVAIRDEAMALGLIEGAAEIRPISTSDFPTAARRPAYSVLEKSKTVDQLGQAPPHWRHNLRTMLQGIHDNG